MKRYILALITCALALLGSGASATCRALLIGIEDYPHLERRPGLEVGLPGPSNDVKRVADLLQKRYGIKSDDLKIMLNSEATHDGIKTAVTGWLANSVKKGDVVVIYFSGHGSSLPDTDGDEQDGKDEAFVCNDMNPEKPELSQYVIDDEFSSWLKILTGKGAEIVFIADCCHSGTISRDFVSGSMDKYLLAPESLVRRMGGWPTAKSIMSKEASQDDDAGVTLIAACLDDQTSATAHFPGVAWMGALTYKLVDYLDSTSQNPTYRELGNYLQKSVSAKFHQTPQVSGPNLSKEFLHVSQVTVSATTSTNTVVNTTVTTTVSAPVTSDSSTRSDKLSIFIQGFGSDTNAIANALNATGYIVVADSQMEADRIIVRQSGTSFNVHFDLRDGNIEDKVSASNALEMVKRLRSSLMRAYVWKRLANLQSEDESLQPEVYIDSTYQKNLSIRPTAFQPIGTVVKIGTKTTFQFKSAKPCYITLIDLPTEGPLTVLFPNNYNSASERVLANHLYAIPSEDMNFDIIAEGPAGRDIVIAIASESPLDLSSLNLSAVDPRTGIAQSSDEDAGAKLLRVVAHGNQGVVLQSGFAIAYVVAQVVN